MATKYQASSFHVNDARHGGARKQNEACLGCLAPDAVANAAQRLLIKHPDWSTARINQRALVEAEKHPAAAARISPRS